MGQTIDFDSATVASLRRRVAQVEEAHRHPIAYARGHSGAVSAAHAAALAAVDAEGAEHLVHVVTQPWPDLLGLDAGAFALHDGGRALPVDSAGLHPAEPRMTEQLASLPQPVVLRAVARGHPLFGPACALIRGGALVRLEGATPGSGGVLLAGRRRAHGFATRPGSEPLLFLGRILSRMAARWLPC